MQCQLAVVASTTIQSKRCYSSAVLKAQLDVAPLTCALQYGRTDVDQPPIQAFS